MYDEESLFPNPADYIGMEDSPIPRPSPIPKRDRPIRFQMTDSEKASLVLQLLTEWMDSEEEAIRFMRLHPSTCLQIPPANVTEKMLAERMIVERLEDCPTQEAAQNLARVQGRTQRDVVKTFTKATGRSMPCRVVKIGKGFLRIAV